MIINRDKWNQLKQSHMPKRKGMNIIRLLHRQDRILISCLTKLFRRLYKFIKKNGKDY